MDPAVTTTDSLAGETFARLFEAVHEGVYIGLVDARGSSTLFANPFLKLMFGFAADTPGGEVRPFEIDLFVDPQARELFLERLRRDGAVTDYLLRLRRADRALVWIEVTAHAEDADGSALRVEALMRDVSERKRLEDQARDLYHQLLQAEKLAALGQTISGVAHELNNPLATILTWAERLSQREVDEPTKRGLDTILAESERAARIVRNLLTFARKRHTTRSMVDLNQVVRETLALRRYEQRLSNINILEAFAAGLPGVFADSHQIQQVLLNLIINAEQAMLGANGRGTLIIRTWHDPQKDAVILEVHDDGPGVPEDVQPRVFDPFFTTKEVGKGTGLGLTVAYAIVQEHAGRITLKSGPSERGVVLRRAAGGKQCAQARRAGAGARPNGRLRRIGAGGGRRSRTRRRGVRGAGRRRLQRLAGERRARSARARERAPVRSDRLRSEDAATGRPRVLPAPRGRKCPPRAPRPVRHRRRRRNRCRTVPGRDWLPLAAEAFSPERSPESRQRNTGLSPRVRGPQSVSRETIREVRGRADSRTCGPRTQRAAATLGSLDRTRARFSTRVGTLYGSTTAGVFSRSTFAIRIRRIVC